MAYDQLTADLFAERDRALQRAARAETLVHRFMILRETAASQVDYDVLYRDAADLIEEVGDLMSQQTKDRCVRFCDACGHESYCPVWFNTFCGAMVVGPSGAIERCPGHYVKETR